MTVFRYFASAEVVSGLDDLGDTLPARTVAEEEQPMKAARALATLRAHFVRPTRRLRRGRGHDEECRAQNSRSRRAGPHHKGIVTKGLSTDKERK